MILEYVIWIKRKESHVMLSTYNVDRKSYDKRRSHENMGGGGGGR